MWVFRMLFPWPGKVRFMAAASPLFSTSSLSCSCWDVITFIPSENASSRSSPSLQGLILPDKCVADSHSLCFPRALNQTIAALWTPGGAGEIPHFLFLLSVLKKELENLIQCRRLLKPRASRATAQELQFCKELKVNPWSKGGVTWEFLLGTRRI